MTDQQKQMDDLLYLIEGSSRVLEVMLQRIEQLEVRLEALEKFNYFGKNQRTSPVEN